MNSKTGAAVCHCLAGAGAALQLWPARSRLAIGQQRAETFLAPWSPTTGANG